MPNKKPNLKAGAKATPNASESFCTPDETKSQVVLVNDELKQLARNYTDAWLQINSEYVQQQLPDLCARFVRVENADEALRQVKAFRDYVHGSKASKIKLPTVASSENLPLPLGLVLPQIFFWPADDIAKSENDHDVKRGCDVEAAKLYLAIFERSQFKRLVLSDATPNNERAELLAGVQRGQKHLVTYLQAMVQQAHPHIVKISAAVKVEVDCEQVEDRGAAKRAILALACLHNKASFTIDEFSRVFYGVKHTPGDLAKEFTTAVRAAKQLLPGLSYVSDNKGRRTIGGVHFVVLASSDRLQQSIAMMLGGAEK